MNTLQGNIEAEALTGDHELLTPNGWIPISKVNKNTTIAQYNDEDGSIEFVKPIKVSHHHQESTYLFESKQGHIRQAVSPNHRMFLKRRCYRPGAEYKSEVVLASELPQSKLNGFTRFINAGNKRGGYKTELTPQERILIAIFANGNFNKTLNRNGELVCSGKKLATFQRISHFLRNIEFLGFFICAEKQGGIL